MNKSKIILIVLCTLLAVSLISCNQVANSQADTATDPINNSDTALRELEVHVTFLEVDEAIEVLAAEDDYTTKLSKFDYASKYKSEKPLDVDERKSIYAKYVLSFTEEQKSVLNNAMDEINLKLKDIGMDFPDISFILTDPEDEGGAAYTRSNAIILKPRHISGKDSDSLINLILHEMFHVYSRLNKDMREDIYKIISYNKCEELIIPDELKELTIANPDAPNNNYYINCDYDGVEYSFIPLIYSTDAYDIEAGGSFFRTLSDDLLAVEIIDGEPVPVYVDGDLLLITKTEANGYFDKIGHNTNYTYHPEETMADNFVVMVLGKEVASPWVVEGLRNVLLSE